jgi:hypothetical protein
MQSLEMWKQRRIVVEQEILERYAQNTIEQSTTDTTHRFLWYEPLYLQNHFYGKVLNQWRAVWIYASVVAQPVIGPHIPGRFQMAVDICRTHAALGVNAINGPQWWPLYYAGLAFGNKNYPLECDWIMGMCRKIGRLFPVLLFAMNNMPTTWAEEEVHWNPLGRLFAPVDYDG